MKRTAIIMAGGAGERFWPSSRKSKPKQLLNLNSKDKSLIQESIERILPIIDIEDIFIITSELLLDPIRIALPDLPPENVIAEPAKRNTAPCLALGASIIKNKYSQLGFSDNEISIAVLTADQLISPNDKFCESVDLALNYVENNPVLCTIGINPERIETGYGYIEIDSIFNTDEFIKPVIAFREKPNYNTAKEYLESGRYLWNSGMFFWRLDSFINSMIKCLPEVGLKIEEMNIQYNNIISKPLNSANENIKLLFESFPNESIDYGLMEKADNVVVAKALFNWDDVGSWDSLDRVRTKNEAGNITEGDNLLVDCKDTIIINNVGGREFVIAGLGLENFVIVANDDAIMICPKDKVQEIKKLVTELHKSGRHNLL